MLVDLQGHVHRRSICLMQTINLHSRRSVQRIWSTLNVRACSSESLLRVWIWSFQLIITTATCKNPSPNPAALPSSSKLAPMGATAPWSTGCASRGDRRLGKILGSTLFNAVPSVCGCFDGKRSGIRDWTTLMWPAFPDTAVPSSSDVASGIVCEVPWLADVGR